MPARDPSITQERVINFLRTKGYRFHKQCPRVMQYKNGRSIIHVPRSTTIDEDWVRGQFKYIPGVSADDVNAFLAACRS